MIRRAFVQARIAQPQPGALPKAAGHRTRAPLAWVLFGALSACGGESSLSNSQLNEAVAAQQDTLAECASDRVEEIEVEVSIAADGDVEEARASGSPRVAACVERVIQTWTFPAGNTSIEAALPLTITPPPDTPDQEK